MPATRQKTLAFQVKIWDRVKTQGWPQFTHLAGINASSLKPCTQVVGSDASVVPVAAIAYLCGDEIHLGLLQNIRGSLSCNKKSESECLSASAHTPTPALPPDSFSSQLFLPCLVGDASLPPLPPQCPLAFALECPGEAGEPVDLCKEGQSTTCSGGTGCCQWPLSPEEVGNQKLATLGLWKYVQVLY